MSVSDLELNDLLGVADQNEYTRRLVKKIDLIENQISTLELTGGVGPQGPQGPQGEPGVFPPELEAEVDAKLKKGTKTILCIDNGDFATGQAALNAASSGDTVVFGAKSGGWGDLVIPTGMRLSLVGLQAERALSVQVGAISFSPTTGVAANNEVHIQGLFITSSSSTCVTFGGSAPGRMLLSGCYVYAGTTNRAIEVNNTQVGSSFYMYDSVVNGNGDSATMIESSCPYTRIYRTVVNAGGLSVKVNAGLLELVHSQVTLSKASEIVSVAGGVFNSSSCLFTNSTTNGSGVLVATGAVFSEHDNLYSIATGTGYCVRGTGTHLYGSVFFNNSVAAAGNVKMQTTLTNIPYTLAFTPSA